MQLSVATALYYSVVFKCRGVVSSTECANNAPLSDLEDIELSEALEHHPEDNIASDENPGYFTRVLTGNVSVVSSGYSIIKSITEGAQHIGHKLIQTYYQDDTAILLSSITDTCQVILNTVRKYNGQNNFLVQEKWLNETEYLLQNKVLTVGVFGRHKAGKSTLLNAILCHEVLSVANTNETAFVLRIYHIPINHHGSSCFEDTEQSLSMKSEETKGRRKIRKLIQKRNSDIRGKATAIVIDEVVAHVPFLCRCSTGDINIVLLDTPGLSESDTSSGLSETPGLSTQEISKASEHQLMTCSAYVYVISSQQMEDTIDTDSLRAIVMRDPNVFEERRILIAVTRLDQYNTTTSEDESDSDLDSDDESSPSNDDGEIPKRIESIKEVVQRQCKCLGTPIPDDCIIPLCATRALKARKKIMKVTSKKPIQESKLSTANERDKISQVPLLEEKLNKITAKSQYLWYYSIVRDCTRYCDQAMGKLDETKKEFMKLAKEFSDKVKEKEDNLQEFETLVKNFRFKYEKGSEFSQQLQVTYNEDLKTNHDNIDRISNSHLSIFESFRSEIKERKPKITTAQFNSEAKRLVKNENESLRNDLKDQPFKQMDLVVKDSVHKFGSTRQRLEQHLASYCNTTTSTSDESHLLEDSIISKSVCDSRIPVSSTPPLKLRDVLEQSEVHYSFWDTIFIFFNKFFVSLDDPERQLRNAEIDALVMELEKGFVASCHDFFTKIKQKIIEGYVKEHRKIAEKHIADVEQYYSEQRKKMDSQVKKWRKQAGFNKEMAQRQSDLIDKLEAQKKHLLALAEKHHKISLFSKHLQDE